MVHELLSIRNGRVDMSRVPGIRPELSVRCGSSSVVERPISPFCHTGNYIDDINGPIFPSTSSRNLWRPRDGSQVVCPVVPGTLRCATTIFNQFDNGNEAFRGGVS